MFSLAWALHGKVVDISPATLEHQILFTFADLELCFILNATGKKGKGDFKKMIGCIKYLIHRIGVKSANYCLISFRKGKTFQHVRFDLNSFFKEDKDLLFKRLDALNPPVNCSPALHDDFAQAVEAFKSHAIRETSKKVNVGHVILQAVKQCNLQSCNINFRRYHGTRSHYELTRN